MSDWLEELIKERDERRRSSHATWDGALFQKLCQTLVKALSMSLKNPDRRAIQSYVSMLEEAQICAYLTSWEPYGHSPKTSLEYALTLLVPQALGAVKPKRRCPLLVKIWNIGEGLLREPPWLDQYVLSRLPQLEKLESFESFVTDLLEPVLKPIAKSDWRGPFQVTRVNTRGVDSEFLPGAMRLAGPSVLLVKDRERDAQLTLLLRKNGESQVLRAGAVSPIYVEDFERPKLQFRLGTLSIGSQLVELPHLAETEEEFVTESGFVVLSAADSQSLWVVESP